MKYEALTQVQLYSFGAPEIHSHSNNTYDQIINFNVLDKLHRIICISPNISLMYVNITARAKPYTFKSFISTYWTYITPAYFVDSRCL